MFLYPMTFRKMRRCHTGGVTSVQPVRTVFRKGVPETGCRKKELQQPREKAGDPGTEIRAFPEDDPVTDADGPDRAGRTSPAERETGTRRCNGDGSAICRYLLQEEII